MSTIKDKKKIRKNSGWELTPTPISLTPPNQRSSLRGNESLLDTMLSRQQQAQKFIK